MFSSLQATAILSLRLIGNPLMDRHLLSEVLNRKILHLDALEFTRRELKVTLTTSRLAGVDYNADSIAVVK